MSLDPRLRRESFRIEGRTYSLLDAVLAAGLRPDWDAFVDALRWGLAGEQSVSPEQTGHLDAAVDEAAREFRYARDLVAADDLVGWLKERDLSLAEWRDALQRAQLRDAGSRSAASVSAESLCGAMWSELLCSGALARFCDALACRAALRAAAADTPVPRESIEARVARASPTLALVAPEVEGGSRSSRIRLLGELECHFEQRREAEPAPELVARAVRSNQIEWIRLRLRALAAPSDSAARELRLRVVEDGERLDQIALELRRPLEDVELLLEDAPPDARSALVGAEVGEVLGPIRWHGEPLAVAVRTKQLPDPMDPRIRDRAAQCLFEQVVVDAVQRSVEWTWLP